MPVIISDMEQGSIAWHNARLGIPTASEFKRIITPTGKLSASRDEYLGELLAEWALGEPMMDLSNNEWVERGKVLEPEARNAYRVLRGGDITQVGFVYRDEDRMVGCSPDAFVDEEGCLEIKVPMAKNHLLWFVRGCVPKSHIIQCQAQLWITGRAWVDFMSYHPELPEVLHRVEPHEPLFAAFDKHIPVFCEELAAGDRRGG